MHPTPEAAIESACTLLDQGTAVSGIGTGDPDDTISSPEIARIYEMWLRARTPLGIPMR